jgi:hypothetical protein
VHARHAAFLRAHLEIAVNASQILASAQPGHLEEFS